MTARSNQVKVAEQEGLEPPTLSGSRFQGGFFIQPGLLRGLTGPPVFILLRAVILVLLYTKAPVTAFRAFV